MVNKISERRSLLKRFNGITMPISRKRIRWNRNWLCLCGSNKKYKNCCLLEIEALTMSDDNSTTRCIPDNIQAVLDAISGKDHKRG